MSDKHLHCLLVPAEPGRVVGVITSKDIIQVLCEGETDMLDQLRVSDVMTAPALCVQEELLIEDCLKLMRMSGVRSVPVVRGLTPVGILSFTDVLRAASA
jgi:CBS domain-containing protein